VNNHRSLHRASALPPEILPSPYPIAPRMTVPPTPDQTPPGAPGRPWDSGLSAFWAFSEATCFFIVPDVFLARLVLRTGLAHSWRQCRWALLGAIAGGLVIYGLSRAGMGGALAGLFVQLPGIAPELMAHAHASLAREGWLALLSGALTGTPYKLYALHAGVEAAPLLPFVLASAVARLLRFSLACPAAWTAARVLGRRFARPTLLRLHVVYWCLFYIAYFGIMGW